MIVKLKNSNYDEFKLKTLKSLNKENASSLVGKHIHFSWHDRNTRTFCNIPGKVLECLDNKLRIYTNDIVMIDNSNGPNNMVYDIEFNDISNIHVFDDYNKNFQDLYDLIEEENIANSIYTITNIYGSKMEVIIIDLDYLAIEFIYKDEIINRAEYPMYLISSIEKNPELVTVFGRPAKGKTSFMVSKFNHLIEQGHKTLFLSLETNYQTISKKLIDGELSFTHTEVIKDFQEINKLIENIKPEYVLIDYLELLPKEENSIKYLRELVNKYNINIYVASNLSRKFADITDESIIREGLKDNLIYMISDRSIIL